jgi:hypothetical protein
LISVDEYEDVDIYSKAVECPSLADWKRWKRTTEEAEKEWTGLRPKED